VDVIDARMPLGTPDVCDTTCSELVTDYILASLQDPPVTTCATPQPLPPRALRLLNRREYRNTLRDLLNAPAAACTAHQDCNLATESCVQGRCAADPCGTHTFILAQPNPVPATVVVAGSFNAWGATAATGGWAMEYVPASNLWFTKRVVTPETHLYKFVADGTRWMQDTANPQAESDGFGGFNSRLTVTCTGTTPASWDPGARIPVETRPEGFPYDTHGAGVVTSVHVEEYLRVGEEVSTILRPGLVPCSPTPNAAACARQFISSFGSRAWRRPLTAAEAIMLTTLITSAATFDAGVSLAVQVMLSSPFFLYRSEVGTEVMGVVQLDAYEVASALSYFLWASMPDADLFEAAATGALLAPEGRTVQAARMLADPRARDVLGAFALQWLGAENVLTSDKTPQLFPGFTMLVRQSLAEETRRFMGHVVVDQQGSLADLLTSGNSVVNATVASFYGLPGTVTDWRVMPVGTVNRAGILSHASVLAASSHSDQTSPIRRGLLVRKRMLCQEFGVPPANAGMVPEVDPNATTRERFRQHSQNPECYSCHQFIDGVGFGLENFDAVGQYRTHENTLPVDTAGDLTDVEGFGTMTSAPFSTVAQLGQILASSRSAEACFVRQVQRFATGRHEDDRDRCRLEALTQQFHDGGQNIRALILQLVASSAFVQREP